MQNKLSSVAKRLKRTSTGEMKRGPKKSQQCCVGIDFGARKAGTTVIAWNEGNKIYFEQSVAGRDADLFLREMVTRLTPHVIAIDAPLSLPGVYRNIPGCSDFHLRECDRTLKAMSPMFLGGLTARAMALAAKWQTAGISVYESYPRQVAARLGLESVQREAKQLTNYFDQRGFQISRRAEKISKHVLDAWLCLLPFVCGLPLEAVGKKREGCIYLPVGR